MKKVMTILTAAAFVLGAAGMVSFTVKQQNDESTGWFYADSNGDPNPNEPGNPNSAECETGNPQPCLIEVNLDDMEPTGNSIKGDRTGH